MTQQIIVGFTGLKRSGKDTMAQILVKSANSSFDKRPFLHVNFADPLRSMVIPLLKAGGYDEDTINDILHGSMKEVPLDVFGGKTYRYLMQTLGTEWGRHMITDKIWLNLFGATCDANPDKDIVCSDVRFRNELSLIHERKGRVYRVYAPWIAADDAHASEQEMMSMGDNGLITNVRDDHYRKFLAEQLAAFMLRDFNYTL